MTQTKGTGEAHPFLSPEDEFAGFEIWDKGNLERLSVAKEDRTCCEYEYAREAALKNGLKLEKKLGTSTRTSFGLDRQSSDSHTGLSAMTEEDNFFGKIAAAASRIPIA